MNIELKEVIKQVLLTSHPVGSLFFTKDNRNPDEILFGGGGVTKWKQIEGRFIYGASASHPIGQTGGEESHQLTESEMPNHTHQGFYWAKEEPGWEIDLNVGIVGMYQSACNFYIKYNNGVLHQGTKVRVPAVPSNNSTTGSTNWLVPFVNADYNATGTMIADGGNTNYLRTLLTRSKDKITVNLWNSNSVATGETYWTIQAMGRWK